MTGYLFDGVECEQCGRLHSLFLDAEDGAFTSTGRYVFVCSQTGDIATIRQFRSVLAVASKPGNSIDCLPG